MRLDPGEAYAVEDVTPADERLSILLKGKYVISCLLLKLDVYIHVYSKFLIEIIYVNKGDNIYVNKQYKKNFLIIIHKKLRKKWLDFLLSTD